MKTYRQHNKNKRNHFYIKLLKLIILEVVSVGFTVCVFVNDIQNFWRFMFSSAKTKDVPVDVFKKRRHQTLVHNFANY